MKHRSDIKIYQYDPGERMKPGAFTMIFGNPYPLHSEEIEDEPEEIVKEGQSVYHLYQDKELNDR